MKKILNKRKNRVGSSRKKEKIKKERKNKKEKERIKEIVPILNKQQNKRGRNNGKVG